MSLFLAKHRKIKWQLLDETIGNMDVACKVYDEDALLKGTLSWSLNCIISTENCPTM
jgi:hypothetical protein